MTDLETRLKRAGGQHGRNMSKSQIIALTISVASTEDIRKMATVHVTSDDLNQVTGGLYDPHMGAINDGKCAECHQDVNRCPGHFGFIELYQPFAHPSHLKTIARLMNSFCHDCIDEQEHLKLLFPPEELEQFKNIAPAQRLRIITDKDSPVKKGCPEHQCKNYTVSKDSRILYHYRGAETVVSVETLKYSLERMSNDDLRLLGVYSRPENMILELIPVLPINLRPPNVQDGSTKHNDMTMVYKEIIAANKAKDTDKVRLYYRGLLDNKQGACKGIHGHPYTTFKQLIDGKTGHLRGTAYGKRGDYSARTVITPDPNLKIYEVGIPEAMAEGLTTEEEVTSRNLEAVKEMILDGKVKFIYPSTGGQINMKAILDKTEIEYKVGGITKKFELQSGDKVKRSLKNGDPVILGRQPTLHKQSIMCFLAKITKGKTIRLPPSVAGGYNADFDGKN